jgi:hypothetical protein
MLTSDAFFSRVGWIGDESSLMVQWYNSETKLWIMVPNTDLVGQGVSATLPASVLSNPAFSGLVTGMVVTTQIFAALAECLPGQDLVGGECRDRPVSQIVKLESYTPGCVDDANCHIICAKAGWGLMVNADGTDAPHVPQIKCDN